MASNDEYSYELRIPKERIAVLIGIKGEVKKQLELVTKTKIEVDSDEGEVTISGTDALYLYTAKEIIRAIGRGFNPEIAQLLLKQDYSLEIIDISTYAKNKDDMIRLRGRVIGECGKSRRIIEDLTQTHISIFGKSVAIIGSFEGIGMARRAVETLLEGAPHSNVYKWLEKRAKELKKKSIIEAFEHG